MCGCLTFSSKAAGFRISSLTILTGWEKCERRNTSQILGLRKNCSLFCKSWFSFLCSEKRNHWVTQVLLKSFENILSATNHYLILLKGLLGRILQLLYRYNNTSLLSCMSRIPVKLQLTCAAHLTHHLVTCARFVALEPGEGKCSGCGGGRSTARAELIAALWWSRLQRMRSPWPG